MGTVRMLARSEISRRWRSTVLLAVLVGLIGALVLAASAGARRSGTALARFNAFSRTSDLEISVGPNPSAARLDAFRRSPGVVALARLHGYAIGVQTLPNLAMGAPVDSAMGNVVDRSRVIAGRQTDPAASDEVTIGEGLANTLHVRVGDTFKATTYTPQQVYDGFHGKPVLEPKGPVVPLRVVGIVRRPLDLGVRAASGGVALLTPAFAERYGPRVGLFTDVLRVKARRATDIPEVVAAARRIFGKDQTFQIQPLGIETEGARNAIDVLTLTLWIFAGLATLAGAIAIGIVLSRDIGQSALDPLTLKALGVTRTQGVAATMTRALIVAIGGAAVGGIVAVLLSPRFPLGVARRADPDVGLHADWTVLALGTALIGAFVLVIGLVAAWRAIRATGRTEAEARARTSTTVDLAIRAGLPPTASNGLRMALQPGRGRSAVPIRSGLVGAMFGVAGITAVLVFASSLTHLVDTPRLAGWTWNFKAEVPTSSDRRAVCVDRDDHALAKQPGVEAVAAVCIVNVEVDGRSTVAWGLQDLHGEVVPEVVAGRAPTAPDEVALGAVTLRALHKHVGDRVEVHGQRGARTYRVVGVIVLPTIDEAEPLADGAVLTAVGLAPIINKGENETHYLLARYSTATTAAKLRRGLAHDPQITNFGGPGVTAVEVSRLQQIDAFPAILAALFAILALVAVGHTIVTSVRRRRRELALFKTIGFRRRHVAATVAWQATTVGIIGLVVGIPVGLVIGRLVWRAVANSLGIAVVTTVPVWWLVALAVATLALVNVVAFLPARAAARTKPAVALRAE